ncbi:unnamed protein product, partial [Vitis vinifera]|uniref:Uncharacterized protein n=1 Tax=Vitis vinifera TaxID=29760 RepID=D7T3B6_VITVI
MLRKGLGIIFNHEEPSTVSTTWASIRLFSCICPTGLVTLWISIISLFICYISITCD